MDYLIFEGNHVHYVFLCLLGSVKTSFWSFWVALAKSFYLRYSELD